MHQMHRIFEDLDDLLLANSHSGELLIMEVNESMAIEDSLNHMIGGLQ